MKVAKILYRMGNLLTELKKQFVNDEFHKGYLKCYDDMLSIIQQVDRETTVAEEVAARFPLGT